MKNISSHNFVPLRRFDIFKQFWREETFSEHVVDMTFGNQDFLRKKKTFHVEIEISITQHSIIGLKKKSLLSLFIQLKFKRLLNLTTMLHIFKVIRKNKSNTWSWFLNYNCFSYSLTNSQSYKHEWRNLINDSVENSANQRLSK